MGKLYEICTLCKGTGKMPPDHKGFDHECFCKPLRVVEVGVTTGQLRRMVDRETAEQIARAKGAE
jgi:hypothetical protein